MARLPSIITILLYLAILSPGPSYCLGKLKSYPSHHKPRMEANNLPICESVINIVINFRNHKINWMTYKMTRISTLIKNKREKNSEHLYRLKPISLTQSATFVSISKEVFVVRRTNSINRVEDEYHSNKPNNHRTVNTEKSYHIMLEEPVLIHKAPSWVCMFLHSFPSLHPWLLLLF